MRIVVHGQQDFGKAVLERLLERGEDVVAVCSAPTKEGRPADSLVEFAQEKGLPVYQPVARPIRLPSIGRLAFLPDRPK